jgi:plasmid stabilization system protein ParE
VSKLELEILPVAEAEIKDVFLWYAERSAIAAEAFRAEVFETIELLSTNALMWPKGTDGTRQCLLHHFPYTVVYSIKNNIVTVLAIAHQRRQPGYWRERS